MTKGIHSPWAKKPDPAKAEDAPIEAPQTRLDEAPPLPVRFPGQSYVLQVGIVLPKRTKVTPEQGERFGRIVLGAALKELFAKAPKARDVFARQGLTAKPPLGPKVTLELGELTLYAGASSTDLPLATKMAVDRVVLALMECRTTFAPTRQILRDFHVDTVLRTS